MSQDFISTDIDNNVLEIYLGNNLEVLDKIPHTFRLCYTDPPFNTGKIQTRKSIKVKSSDEGDRSGWKGKSYASEIVSNMSYEDKFDDLSVFLYPRVEKIYDKLSSDGSMLIHLDYREVHDVKVNVMDKIFGRSCFINEIIWAYDYGARSTSKWSAKHDTILWYVKDPDNYIFNYGEVDRIPYMAPGLQPSKERVEAGKTITDVWWHTIVCGKEKTGYPTQKPRGILDRLVKVHSKPGDYLIDPFAGSGSFGDSALHHSRNCVLIDENRESLKTMEKNLAKWDPIIK